MRVMLEEDPRLVVLWAVVGSPVISSNTVPVPNFIYILTAIVVVVVIIALIRVEQFKRRTR